MHYDTTEQRTAKAPRPKRAVIFARVRIVPYDDVREFTQFKAQVRACREVANGLGAVAVSVYEARGGTSDPGVRQTIEQLLREVEGGGIGYLNSSAIVGGIRSLYKKLRGPGGEEIDSYPRKPLDVAVADVQPVLLDEAVR